MDVSNCKNEENRDKFFKKIYKIKIKKDKFKG
jgi:hypothetical protein